MKRKTVWHKQLSSLLFLSSGCVCRRVYMRVFSLYCLWTSRAKADASRQMCVQKVTLRHRFLNSLTLATERGKKARCGTHCWQPLRGVSMKQTRTQIKKRIPVTPLPVLLWWCEGGIAAWGAPLETGTEGRKEMTHWSRVTTFCLFFSFLWWLHVKMSVFFMHPFRNSFEYMCASIQLFSTHL